MPQAENAGATSSKPKRTYRKGNPLTALERQKASLAKKQDTHKTLHAVIGKDLKDKLREFAVSEGVTQAEMIELLIQRECERRDGK